MTHYWRIVESNDGFKTVTSRYATALYTSLDAAVQEARALSSSYPALQFKIQEWSLTAVIDIQAAIPA